MLSCNLGALLGSRATIFERVASICKREVSQVVSTGGMLGVCFKEQGRPPAPARATSHHHASLDASWGTCGGSDRRRRAARGATTGVAGLDATSSEMRILVVYKSYW